jgi:formylglycine-generating enzyme required for sulfatase activity
MKIAHWLCAVLCLCGAGAPAPAQAPDTLLYTLLNPSSRGREQQGYAVAGDGNIVVVGAPHADIGATNVGVVKIYDLSSPRPLTPKWVLNNPAPVADDEFGSAVAVSGQRVAVGAYRFDTAATDAGAVYVYDLASPTPTAPAATLKKTGPSNDDNFGISVAISGTRVVVGAHRDDTGAADAGRVFVYNVTNAVPNAPVATITNPSPTASDYFGRAVSISGTRILVGAFGDGTGASGAGSAYVFDLTNAAPATPVFVLNNPNPAVDDGFGIAVSIFGHRVAVGAWEDDTGAYGAGRAYLYDLSTGTPTAPAAVLNNPSPDIFEGFGLSVNISGNHAVVGCYGDDTGATDAGSAYVYDLTSGTPTSPIVVLNNPDAAADDQFGWFVAVFGGRAVVGAPGDDKAGPNSGGAYVYDLTSPAPSEPSFALNSASSASGAFGDSIALSGRLLAVGCDGQNGGGTNSGIVFVYDLGGPTPTVPMLKLQSPSASGDDVFGASLALSGSRLLVGAFLDDTSGTNSGRAFLFDLTNSTPATPVVTFANPSPANDAAFGIWVAMDGHRALIGALPEIAGMTNVGIAYVYDLTNASPSVPILTIDNPTPDEYDYFGAVAVSGDRAVVGAYNDDADAPNSGIVYVYNLTNASPATPVLTLHNPDPDPFDRYGAGLAFHGSRVVVGAYYDSAGATWAGSAYVFDLDSATPGVPAVTIHNPDPAAAEYFGAPVAIFGSRLLIASGTLDPGVTANAGIVHSYDLRSAYPMFPVSALTNPAPDDLDLFGSGLAISENRMAIGAPWDGGITNWNSGIVYVYGPALDDVVITNLARKATNLLVQFSASSGMTGWTVKASSELRTGFPDTPPIIGPIAETATGSYEATVAVDIAPPNAGSLRIEHPGTWDALNPVPTVPPGLALIPGGDFVMGDATNVLPASEGEFDEGPQHTVGVSSFYMDRYEVTKSLWDEVIAHNGGNGYDYANTGFGKAGNHPVNTLTWYDAVKWCNARSQKEGLTPVYYTDAGLTTVYKTNDAVPFVNWSANGHRLPTEAEWEKAARGGALNQRFPWPDYPDTISHTNANYQGIDGLYGYDLSVGYHPDYNDFFVPYTSPVGSFGANGYGLYDMAGNVEEWCWDWYDAAYYGSSPTIDPIGPTSGDSRLIRGGSWAGDANEARIAKRNANYGPDGSNYTIGFRCVRRP